MLLLLNKPHGSFMSIAVESLCVYSILQFTDLDNLISWENMTILPGGDFI